jgi:asparagine synthase (glutamine-hydrolysing)
MPIKNRLQDTLKPFMMEILNPSDINKMGIFQPAYITEKIQQHVNGSHNHAHLLWALIVLMVWWKQHCDGH